MKWLKRAGTVFCVVLLILAVVPLFFSLDDYIPAIEREVSARLKEPVKIGSLRAAGLPLLYPTGGTVAGAAAGTAVLGPVLGTALGAKVGQWAENLFGKNEEKKK
jgi:hypothetical protein